VTHIPDVGKGKDNDLTGIGRIRHNLLIARHGGLKTQLSCGDSRAITRQKPIENGAIVQKQCAAGILGFKHGKPHPQPQKPSP
jgi:imidazoleglycerol phosphate dehydratase HisB